jgi:hypothetical protein
MGSVCSLLTQHQYLWETVEQRSFSNCCDSCFIWRKAPALHTFSETTWEVAGVRLSPYCKPQQFWCARSWL